MKAYLSGMYSCHGKISVLLGLICGLLLLGPTAGLAQGLDISDWQIVQANSASIYNVPAGTVVQPGGYLILGRYATKSDFEAFYGVTLGPDVVYLTNPADNTAVPMINGDEIFSVLNSVGGLEDGPTPAFDLTFNSHHRTDPEGLPWNLDNGIPTPGYGVETPDATFSGLVITEATNAIGAGAYVYEFLEFYYDGDGSSSNLSPVITDVYNLPASLAAGDDVTITATAMDSDGTIAWISCFYRLGGGDFTELAMTPVTGDQYSCFLTNLPGDTSLEYYVLCEDDLEAQAISPAAAPGVLYSVWIQGQVSPGKIVLFDHFHDQDAGTNGNWRIDDNYPSPYPPDPTSEADWSGQLSTWGYELYLVGHSLRSSTSALSDAILTDVDLLVIPEPQNPFSADEIEAVRQFVFAGGSLFFIADHNSSDRNGNGWDSPSIFGGYTYPHISDPVGDDVETFCGALFGLHVHVKDEGNNGISGSYTNVNSDPSNPVIHGGYGDVAEIYYHVGNVMTLWPTANAELSSVGGLVSKDEGFPHLAAWSRYGSGKVVGYGDSSSMADGTDSEPHENNWTEAGHRAFFLNASLWLLADDASGVPDFAGPFGPSLQAWPNPFNPQTTIVCSLASGGVLDLSIFDAAGHKVRDLGGNYLSAGEHHLDWDGRDNRGRNLPSGVYLVRAATGTAVTSTKLVLAR